MMAMREGPRVWTLNDVSECVLLVLVSHSGKIEDIISKERISVGLRRAVDQILMKKKELKIMLHEKSIKRGNVLNLVKRMPRLTTIDWLNMEQFNQVLDIVDSPFLEHLWITYHSKSDASFTSRIETFIRSKPLKSVMIKYSDEDRELFLQLVNMLINVTNVHDRHLKEIDVTICQNLGIGERALIVADHFLKYEVSLKGELEDVKFLNQVLSMYPKVKNIDIKLKLPVINIDDITRDCEEISHANRKRVVKVAMMHPTTYDEIVNTLYF